MTAIFKGFRLEAQSESTLSEISPIEPDLVCAPANQYWESVGKMGQEALNPRFFLENLSESPSNYFEAMRNGFVICRAGQLTRGLRASIRKPRFLLLQGRCQILLLGICFPSRFAFCA
jgi:hypothetical protein